MKYLDSVALAKLKGLALRVRRLAAEGRDVGRHRSFAKGLSRDFAQHRPYVPGDEIKSVDWKAYARMDRFYVREYQAESAVSTYLFVDGSGSMAFSSGGRERKWDYACRLAMAAAYLTVLAGDAAGLVVFSSSIQEDVPPKGSMEHLSLLDAVLSRHEPAGTTDLPAVLAAGARLLRRRSLAVIVSDLMGDPEAIVAAVKAFRARRHEAWVLHVLDPDETALREEGLVTFEGMEDGRRIFCDAGLLSRLYGKEFERRMRMYAWGFERSGAVYRAFSSDRPWEHSLGSFLARTG